MQKENAFVVKASFTRPISAGTKTKSAINFAEIVNQVVGMVENRGTHIKWRHKKRRRRRNARCFT